MMCCITFTCIMAQNFSKDNYNYREFQRKPFYFGITMGANSSGFKVNQGKSFFQEDSLRLVESPLTGGFHLRIITNLKIGEHFDFRFIPGFAFSERKFEFRNFDPATNNEDLIVKKFESVLFEAPLLLRFKSEPYRDKRLFIVGGVKYAFDVSSNSRSKRDSARDLLFLSPHDFQLEIGAGMQFFLPFFIFSPEFKFSTGLSNIHIFKKDLNESRIIDAVLSRVFSISLHFEG